MQERKVLLIMKKSTLGFVSVASHIYHCFFSFWICLWCCQMLTPYDFWQPALRLPKICCLFFSPSVVIPVTLHLVIRFKPHRVGQNHSWVRAIVQAACSEESGLPRQDGCCHIGNDSAPGSWWLVSQLFPKNLHPQSLLMHL